MRAAPKYLETLPEGYRRFKKTHIFCNEEGHVLAKQRWGVYRIVGEGINNCGYKVFNNGVTFIVHHIIAHCWIGPRPKGMTINHKNGIKTDNRSINLEYCSHSQNIKHAYDIGLIPKGERHPNATTKEKDVIKIRSLYPLKTMSEISRITGVSKYIIHSIIHGKTWKHI